MLDILLVWFFVSPSFFERLVVFRTRNPIGEGWFRGLHANSGDLSSFFTATDFPDHEWQVSEAKDP